MPRVFVSNEEGVLILVVPAPAVGICARLLAAQFEWVSVFRLEHPESVRFNQVVVFGRRKKAHMRGEPKRAEELLRIAYKPHLLPVLNQDMSERYAGVAVTAKRKHLLALLRRGLHRRQLAFPAHNGAVEWPEVHLVKKAP